MGAMDFTQKYWWKSFISKMYSWGASIVLVGALFKINHWPGATLMLAVGLLTEAAIFFFAGLEPPHEEIDWTLVYPELKVSEDGSEDILSSSIRGKKGSDLSVPSLDALAKFDEMLEKAGEAGLFDKLNTGLTKLSDNVIKLNDITDASVASEEFAKNLKSASEKVGDLSSSYDKLATSVQNSSESLTYSSESLSDSLNKTAQAVGSHKEELDNAYTSLVSSMDVDFSSLSAGNEEYNNKIGSLNKNLTAINAIFELQLEDANLDEMVKDIQESAIYAKKYSEEVTKLSKNLSALNGVYGKMLSAMNIQID